MKSYRQQCGVAKALDRVGERWTLLIIRDLLLGGRRYTDLHRGLPGLTTNLLAKRLQDLESSGIITRRDLPPPAGSTVYELTPLGRELEPAVLALGRFGAHWILSDPSDRGDLRWVLVSLRRRYQGGLAPAQIGLAADGVPYTLTIDHDGLRATDGSPATAPVSLTATAQAMVAIFATGAPPRSVGASIDGDASIITDLQHALEPVIP